MDVTLAELERRLDPAGFVRVSREHVVRIAAIAEVLPLVGGYAEVVLRSGERLPVSRRRLKGLLDVLGAIH
jgi:two-component system LytT family response regulator